MLVLLRCLLTVLFLLMLLQDLVPLGRWNALTTLAAHHPLRGRLLGTLLNAGVVGCALACSLSSRFVSHGWQRSTTIWILGCFLLGAYLSWWQPYLFGGSEAQRQKLRPIWIDTYTVLPVRHGVNPNALHIIFHALALACFGLTLRL